ncbi:sensor histidine kinase KdpD [Pseudomonas sp. MYb185]|uniref:sensor histidine kinase n=1 Tax=Pseudomonas sp. MYb185 TaxID=1848729 RepID=UPI000CFC90ED|nr:HAMP domain-containing sensor histidine kinase [Pseudomonas sp. MYb185]PRB82887.1 histidine kinase [Pseudomonas sp. MYb185]
MNNDDQGLDFSTVLASTVHDMKNSLSLLMQSWNQWLERLPPELAQSGERGVIEYEALRLNGMLMQMLGLYKLQINQLPLRPDWVEVEDLLQEQLARHAEILQARDIRSSCSVEGAGLFFLDAELIGSVIGNVLNNSIRYTRSAIHLHAALRDGMLLLTVNDDGCGYPADMLGRYGNGTQDADVTNGSTGLGLYFGQCIASLHQRDGQHGYIELGNGGELGGGEFRLYLP